MKLETAFIRALTGQPEPPRGAKVTRSMVPESLRQEAARRGVSLYRVRTERALTEGFSKGQGVGKPNKSKGERPIRAARVGQRARALARLRRLSRTGARARFRGKVAKDSPKVKGAPLESEFRTRTVPPKVTYPKGSYVEPTLDPDDPMGQILELAENGEWAEAAAAFTDEIMTVYGMNEAELGDIEWLSIWEPFDPEPEIEDE